MLPLSDDEEIVEGTLRSSNNEDGIEGILRRDGFSDEKIEEIVNRKDSPSGRPKKTMRFEDAVKNVIINNYIGFEGRASRSEYWWFFLFCIFVGIITGMADFVAGWNVITNIVIIALFLPTLSVAVRRLHDIGRSGWWYLIVIIPYIGWIMFLIVMILEGEEHPNQYGEVPTNIIENDDYERYGTF